ncbi:hypothetical protein O6H91_Y124000 [Diphasiastrum complanatum]|nr:hypothetical protein O6H91_Y124000 [Diphasiastrum complanatum]
MAHLFGIKLCFASAAWVCFSGQRSWSKIDHSPGHKPSHFRGCIHSQGKQKTNRWLGGRR